MKCSFLLHDYNIKYIYVELILNKSYYRIKEHVILGIWLSYHMESEDSNKPPCAYNYSQQRYGHANDNN